MDVDAASKRQQIQGESTDICSQVDNCVAGLRHIKVSARIGTVNEHLPKQHDGVVALAMKDFQPAIDDLQLVVAKDPKYDFLRAQALLAHAYGNTGNIAEADRIFSSVTQTSTISETLYNYALFLQSQGRPAEARVWAQKLLDKKVAMPGYLRRRERPWFRKASSLLSALPK